MSKIIAALQVEPAEVFNISATGTNDKSALISNICVLLSNRSIQEINALETVVKAMINALDAKSNI